MGIVKIKVDGIERELITSLDDDVIEENDRDFLNGDTVELDDLVNKIKEKNKDSE